MTARRRVIATAVAVGFVGAAVIVTLYNVLDGISVAVALVPAVLTALGSYIGVRRTDAGQELLIEREQQAAGAKRGDDNTSPPAPAGT